MKYYGNITEQLQFVLVKRWAKYAQYRIDGWMTEIRCSKELHWTSNFTSPHGSI